MLACSDRRMCSPMKIFWFKAQAPQRVLALAKHLHSAAELIEVDMMGGGLRTPEFVALNPNMKAPVLVDGDLVLWESSAIMAHLCIKAGSDMWPANNPSEQVQVLRWLTWCDSHWAPPVAHFYFEHIVKPTFGIGAPDTAALQQPALLADLDRYATVLDAHLRDRRYIACARLTIADFYLASMAMYWRDAHMPIAAHTHVVRWLDGLMQIPAWASPWPASRFVPA